ncbi:MAG: hypothetical protein IH969_09595 [Candidatus Krumholzibacteriota bacterium]|nr:hypothetical protein [Candidatus Krumholzibacteriota bacterium]
MVGHNPGVFETNPKNAAQGYGLTNYLSFLDSLRDDGKLIIRTPEDAYDLMYKHIISPGAAYNWPVQDDINGDGQLDWADGTRDKVNSDWKTATKDSVYTYAHADGRDDHGVFGEGYISLNWDAAWTIDHIRITAGHASAEWYEGGDLQFQFPNYAKGGGVFIAEAWFQIDPALMEAAGTSVGENESPLGTADSLAFTFEAVNDNRIGSKGVSAVESYTPDIINWGGSGNIMVDMDIMPGTGATNSTYYAPPNYVTCRSRDTVGGGWIHLVGRYSPPINADFVYVNVCKDSRFPANAVRMSGFKVYAWNQNSRSPER